MRPLLATGFRTQRASSRAAISGRSLLGASLVLSFLFSGDLVRLHGHPDGPPASTCAACVAGLTSAIRATPDLVLDRAGSTIGEATREVAPGSPGLVHDRPCGLRDPPPLTA